jgi:hypothetical protein
MEAMNAHIPGELLRARRARAPDDIHVEMASIMSMEASTAGMAALCAGLLHGCRGFAVGRRQFPSYER